MLQIFTFIFALLHPYYVSVTEIKHNAGEQRLEISCRVFSDDLESALNKLGHGKVDILNTKNFAQVNPLIAEYIPKHLKISINGKAVNLRFVGYELESEATWCYFEVEGIRSVKKITISNDILYAEHEEQINMMHVIVGGVRKSTKLDNPASTAAFSF